MPIKSNMPKWAVSKLSVHLGEKHERMLAQIEYIREPEARAGVRTRSVEAAIEHLHALLTNNV